MSKWYAEICGDKSTATRRGTDSMTGNIRTWDSGVMVLCGIDPGNLDDTINIFLTYGSDKKSTRANYAPKKIAEIRAGKLVYLAKPEEIIVQDE